MELVLCIFLTTKPHAPRKKCNRSFPDPYSTCVNQGTIADRLDYNIQNDYTSVEEGHKQLQKVWFLTKNYISYFIVRS